MSSSPQLRRADRQMSDARVEEMLARGYCGRLGTVGADGYPYVVPLLYVWMDGKIYTHNTIARMTGKETPLPAISQQWPTTDRTKTPQATPPGSESST